MAAGARPPKGSYESANVRVDVRLVQIPTLVTTPSGAPVTDLKADSFHIFEDGVEQAITHFSSEDEPISIGLLLDTSGSMRAKMWRASKAAIAFLKTANADDEFFLVEFNDRPKLVVPFTANSVAMYKKIAHAKAVGRTSLLDAIRLALLEMTNAKNTRKAILIFSDGGDNRSRYTEREIEAAVREADVQVYAMGIFDPDEAHRKPIEEKNGPKLLEDLAEDTGGRHYPVDQLDQLPAVAEKIAAILRSQYVLGYAPSNLNAAGYRRIEVKVPVPLRAHYRSRYFFKTGP